MGILRHLLAWPVTTTTFLVGFSLRQAGEVALREVADDSRVREDLLELQLQLELGEIDDEEYAEREAALMRRFREVREWRRQLGMPTRGGVVSVDRGGAGPGGGAPDADR